VAAGFPTKPSWLKAIKNKQYASWPGLTWEAVNKHFPKSKETLKGHGRKTRSGLQSTKIPAQINNNDKDNTKATHFPCPLIKQKEAIIRTYDLSNKAECLMYTNQTGQFPTKSSRGHQYIMVLIKIDSNAILVKAMKNRMTGEMIQGYQVLVDCPSQRGNYSKNAHSRQRVLSRIQGKNPTQQHAVPACPST
jgi:hypothetical protein